MNSPYAQALLRVAPDAVVVMDEHGRIDRVNPAAERLFGEGEAELVGRSLELLIAPSEREAHRADLERCVRAAPARAIGVERQLHVRRRDARDVPVTLWLGLVPEVQPLRLVAFLRDISQQAETLSRLAAERDRAEASAAEAHRSQSRLMAVSRLATMGEMASGIAHEINQPLTAISNFARACERFASADPPLVEEIRECTAEIAAETQRAAEIVRELRRLVRDHDGQREPNELGDIVRRTQALIQADARVHLARIEFRLAAGLPCVQVDAVQIQQLLLNLVRNALEAVRERPEGERVVRIASTRSPDGDVHLTVEDSGHGIAADVKHSLYEPFISTKARGSGLGLAICRTIARNHGGELTHSESELGGARFVLALPTEEPVPA